MIAVTTYLTSLLSPLSASEEVKVANDVFTRTGSGVKVTEVGDIVGQLSLISVINTCRKIISLYKTILTSNTLKEEAFENIFLK